MAKAKQDKGNPGDEITVPATPDELVSIPTGKDGEAVVMTREEAEKREEEGEKKSLFNRSQDSSATPTPAENLPSPAPEADVSIVPEKESAPDEQSPSSTEDSEAEKKDVVAEEATPTPEQTATPASVTESNGEISNSSDPAEDLPEIDLEAELAAAELEATDQERKYILGKIIDFAKENREAATRNGHRGVAGDFNALGTVATRILERTNREKYWLPRVK